MRNIRDEGAGLENVTRLLKVSVILVAKVDAIQVFTAKSLEPLVAPQQRHKDQWHL